MVLFNRYWVNSGIQICGVISQYIIFISFPIIFVVSLVDIQNIFLQMLIMVRVGKVHQQRTKKQSDTPLTILLQQRYLLIQHHRYKTKTNNHKFPQFKHIQFLIVIFIKLCLLENITIYLDLINLLRFNLNSIFDISGQQANNFVDNRITSLIDSFDEVPFIMPGDIFCTLISDIVFLYHTYIILSQTTQNYLNQNYNNLRQLGSVYI